MVIASLFASISTFRSCYGDHLSHEKREAVKVGILFMMIDNFCDGAYTCKNETQPYFQMFMFICIQMIYTWIALVCNQYSLETKKISLIK